MAVTFFVNSLQRPKMHCFFLRHLNRLGHTLPAILSHDCVFGCLNSNSFIHCKGIFKLVEINLKTLHLLYLVKETIIIVFVCFEL